LIPHAHRACHGFIPLFIFALTHAGYPGPIPLWAADSPGIMPMPTNKTAQNSAQRPMIVIVWLLSVVLL
jgi:hypothetical protein